MRYCLCAALVAVAIAAPGPARAHHNAFLPVGRDYATNVLLRNSLRLEMSTTSLAHREQPGQVLTLAAYAEYYRKRHGFRLRIPVHALARQQSPTIAGVGDLLLGASYRLGGSAWRLAAWADALVPVGDPGSGLGNGTPGGALRVQPAVAIRGRTWISATAGFLANVGPSPGGALVEERADAETQLAIAAAWSSDRLLVAGAMRLALPLAPAALAGTVYASAAPRTAVCLRGNLWLTAFAELPLGDQRQFAWQIGSALDYRWAPGG